MRGVQRGFLADSITYMAAKMGDNFGNAALQNLYAAPHIVETAPIHSVPGAIRAGGNQGILDPGLRFRMRTHTPKERCTIHEHVASFEDNEPSPVAVFFLDSRYCSAGDRFMRASDGTRVSTTSSTPHGRRFRNAGYIRNPTSISDSRKWSHAYECSSVPDSPFTRTGVDGNPGHIRATPTQPLA